MTLSQDVCPVFLKSAKSLLKCSQNFHLSLASVWYLCSFTTLNYFSSCLYMLSHVCTRVHMCSCCSQPCAVLAGNEGECHSFSRKSKRPLISLLPWNPNTLRTHTHTRALTHTHTHTHTHTYTHRVPPSGLFVSKVLVHREERAWKQATPLMASPTKTMFS